MKLNNDFAPLTDTLIVPRSAHPVGLSVHPRGTQNLDNDMISSFERFAIEDDEPPRPILGAPALDVPGLRTSFGSGPVEMMNYFIATSWVDENGILRVSYTILMPSVPQDYIAFSVSEDGLELVMAMTIPGSWQNIRHLNDSMFRIGNDAQYGRSHMRTIAMNEAARQLERALIGPNGYMMCLQRMKLPFKCHTEFTDLEGREGYKAKEFANHMRVAVIELVASD